MNEKRNKRRTSMFNLKTRSRLSYAVEYTYGSRESHHSTVSTFKRFLPCNLFNILPSDPRPSLKSSPTKCRGQFVPLVHSPVTSKSIIHSLNDRLFVKLDRNVSLKSATRILSHFIRLYRILEYNI